MQAMNSKPATRISGKMAGAVLALVLALILAIAYPAKHSAESAATAPAAGQTFEARTTPVAPKSQRSKGAKKTHRMVPKVPVKEEEEEGC